MGVNNVGGYMLELLYLELDLFGVSILLLMFWNLKRKQYSQTTMDQKLFKRLLIGNMLILLFDAIMWCMDDKTFLYAREIHIAASIAYFILNPLGCFLWLVYNDYKVNQDRKRLIQKTPFYLIPSLINAVLTIASPETGWIFYIDSSNHYSRGELFILMPILAYIDLFYGVFLTVRKGEKSDDLIKKELYKYMIFFPLIPFIGSIIQSFFYGLPIIWITSVISLLIIFIHVQNHEILTDQLTGIYNRRHIEELLTEKTHEIEKDKMLYVLLIDVNKFKAINDTYGHLAGDQALIQVTDILKKSCKNKKNSLARMGGDEFLVIGECRSREEIYGLIQEIEENVEEFNRFKEVAYELSLSIGHSIFGEDDIYSIDELINSADEMMYDQKAKAG